MVETKGGIEFIEIINYFLDEIDGVLRCCITYVILNNIIIYVFYVFYLV